MCRHWGIVYGPDGPEAEMWTPSELAQLMFPALVERGRHAWGWLSWDGTTDGFDLQKFPGRCDQPDAIAQMNIDPNAKWVIAHTRHATHGSPEDLRNNHPLIHKNIIGAHNGVLTNHEAILRVTGREDPETKVDSEAIFAAVAKWGHQKGLAKILGSMVAVYIDRRHPHILNFARSQGRELVMARTEAGSLIWASEKQAIDGTGIPCKTFSELGHNTLLRVRNGEQWQRTQFRPKTTLTTRQPSSGTGHRYSASSTRRAMISEARREIEKAERFITTERTRSQVRARNSMMDPSIKVAARRGEDRYGERQGDKYYIGNGKWVSESEYIADILDELGWD